MRTSRTLVAASGSVALSTIAILAISAISGCTVHTQAAVAVAPPPPPPTVTVTATVETAPPPAAVVVAPAGPPPSEPPPASPGVVVAVATPATPATSAPTIDSDDEDYSPAVLPTFQSELDAHGWWVEDQCGTVWVPRHDVVGASFYPYMSHGHWAYTAEGYSWVSDFSWGARTFHYGRWYWSKTWGWVWSPSGRYTTAAVEWRFGGGHMGWRPLPPDRCWRGGHAEPVTTDWEGPGYVFVPGGSFFSPTLGTIAITGERTTTFVGASTVWVPPPRSTGSAVVFFGPSPTVAAIPAAQVTAATVVVPPASRTIHWAPPTARPPVLRPAPPPPARPVGFAPAPGPRIPHPPIVPRPHEGEPGRPGLHPGEVDPHKGPGTHPGEIDPHHGPGPHPGEVDPHRGPGVHPGELEPHKGPGEGEPHKGPGEGEPHKGPGAHPGEVDPHRGPGGRPGELEGGRKPEPHQSEVDPHRPTVPPPMHPMESETMRRTEPTPKPPVTPPAPAPKPSASTTPPAPKPTSAPVLPPTGPKPPPAPAPKKP